MVYGTMVMQAYAVETATRALRRNRPFCMGSLYWQINDVWPVFSWASVDFYGQWKALHYRGRDSYKDILITVTSDKSDPGEIKVHFLNDKLTNVIASAVIDVMDFNGTSYGEFVFNQVIIPANSRRTERISLLLPEIDPNSTFIRANLYNYTNQAFLDNQIYPYARPLDWKLQKP